MSVPIQPLADYVVAQNEKAETKTASGLYLPEKAAEKPKTVKVLAVGKNVKDIKPGEKILYKNTYEATEVKVGDGDYVIIYQKNIVAVVK